MVLQLKKIKFEDKKILFKWANLKSVRNNSLKKKKISYSQHLNWIKKYLNNDLRNIGKIIYKQKKPIGLIRLDKKNKVYFISYLIAPKYRKKGYAYKALKLFIKKIKKPKKIVAIVMNNNKASIKIFGKLSFKLMLKTNKYHKFIYNVKNKKK